MGLLYGCGLRVSEGLRLRVKDVDFGNGLVWVRQAKSKKDRCIAMPKRLADGLRRQVADGSGGKPLAPFRCPCRFPLTFHPLRAPQGKPLAPFRCPCRG
ncbi:tyrosine-type recombinase/integrase [Haloferula sargassicola]|uniref:tyrosine-type recombinase/integrase n=1 Tax=Haloferula sargassicola TaxID=490096 RepID=UPI0033654BC1